MLALVRRGLEERATPPPLLRHSSAAPPPLRVSIPHAAPRSVLSPRLRILTVIGCRPQDQMETLIILVGLGVSVSTASAALIGC